MSVPDAIRRIHSQTQDIESQPTRSAAAFMVTYYSRN